MLDGVAAEPVYGPDGQIQGLQLTIPIPGAALVIADEEIASVASSRGAAALGQDAGLLHSRRVDPPAPLDVGDAVVDELPHDE